jgi:uncharacterized membrane protein (DUF106 family)
MSNILNNHHPSEDVKSIRQRVIHNNQEIHAVIAEELEKATDEIMVAAAWFTDMDLYNILLSKARNGVRVEVIIAENENNNKLDFDQLINAGASVLRIKNVGYGMMHQKYCLIDNNLALHGSYNWTVNARNNNHESIIITNDQSIIKSLKDSFNDMKERASQLERTNNKGLKKVLDFFKGSEKKEKQNGQERPMPLKAEEADAPEISNEPADAKTEYERVLDSMIAAEVSQFDRESLKQNGYNRAKSTNGDTNTLTQAFDSVYSSFINDIDIIEDKKTRLISKIDEQRVKTIEGLNEKLTIILNNLESIFNTKQNILNERLNSLKAQLSINEKEAEQIDSSKIEPLTEKINEARETIKNEDRAFVKPQWRLFELIPVTFILVCLLAYLFLFYSSAAYILLYSEADAQEASRQGIEILPPEVFNPLALKMAFEKQGTAPYFIMLFVIVPLTFALLGRVIKNKVASFITGILFGVVIVDSFIAYSVAKSIHDVEYLRGNLDQPWEFSMIWQNVNFYLVFVMGAFGLLLFKFVFDKFIGLFEERNPDMARLKSNVYVKQLKNSIDEYQEEISQQRSKIQEIKLADIGLQNEVSLCGHELNSLPEKLNNEQNHKKSENLIQIQSIERTTDIYKSHIENDNFLISMHALKDRVNTFLEGWTNFLHEEYSVVRATDKTQASNGIANQWHEQKLSNGRDKRISE